VEEQFYMLMPLVLCGLKDVQHRRRIQALAACWFISFTGCVYGSVFHQGANFFLLPTRAWELLTGSLLAIVPQTLLSSRKRDSIISWAGLMAILVPVFVYDSSTRFPGLAAVPPVMGTASIIFATANTPNLMIGWVLSRRPAVLIGVISYSLYLWHWPIIVFTREYVETLNGREILFALVSSVSIAVLSWKFIETPFRNRRFLKDRSGLFWYALTLSVLVIAVSAFFIGSRGCDWRFADTNVSLLLEDVEYLGREFEHPYVYRENLQLSDLPTLGKETATGEQPDFVVVGDSHGLAMAKCISSSAADLGLSGKSSLRISSVPFTKIASQPNASEELLMKEKILHLIDLSPPKNIILIAYWSNLFNLNLWVPEGKKSQVELIEEGIDDWGRFCRDRNIRLWVVKQVPKIKEPFPARSLLRYAIGRTSTLSDKRITYEEYLESQVKIEKAFESKVDYKIHFVDPAPLLFDENGLNVNYRGGRALYRDDNHLSRWGAEQIRPALEKMLLEISRTGDGSENRSKVIGK
jgi:hypothetical protein